MLRARLPDGAALEVIDFGMQKGLEGPVLEITFAESAHALVRSLSTLSLYGCEGATGAIPAAIGECLVLRTLNFWGCKLSGLSG